MVSMVFAGVGGQGVVTVATLVGRAAVLEGKKALMTELHGMAQRGGKISVELRIGDYRSAIIPMGTADVLIAFERLEAVRNIPKLKEDGLIILNERKIHPISITVRGEEYPSSMVEGELMKHDVKTIKADAIALELGSKRVVNTVMAGALFSTGVTGLREGSLIEAIRGLIERNYWEVNLKAFERGKELLRKGVAAEVLQPQQ